MPDGSLFSIDAAPVVLRDYQSDLLAKGRVGGCLYLPTGGGKTEIGISMCQELLDQGKSVVWLANRIDLIEQTSRRFLKAGLDHGVIQANHIRTASWKPLQIASIQTITRRKMQPSCSAIIIDEAHGAVSPTFKSFLAANPRATLYGLTATPFSKGLGKVFSALHVGVTVSDLTEKGWLVPARFYAPDRPDLSDVSIVAGEYHEGQLAEAVDKVKLVGNIVDEWIARANNGRTLVFATSIKHSEHIRDQFLFRGIACEHIDAYTEADDRITILDRLRSGQTRVVTNCSVLAEGFDLPDLECMVLARPTRSLIRYLQMVGRVLRPAPGKESALVLDHSSTVENLGFPTDDLHLVLDMGSKKVKPAPKPKLHTCPKCKAVSQRKPNPCKACGFTPAIAPIEIDAREGSLRELKREVPPIETRQRYYSALVSICTSKGYAQGWVAHKYKEKFGYWPQRDLRWEAGPPLEEVNNSLLAARIRWAKSQGAQKRYG